MMIVLCICGAIISIMLSGFYSGSETGLYCINKLKLHVDADKGNHQAIRVEKNIRNEQSALSTLLVATNLANYLATIAVAYLLANIVELGPGASEIYTTIIVTPIVFVFGETIPKTIFQKDADRLMRLGSSLFTITRLALCLPTYVLVHIASPIVSLSRSSSTRSTNDPRIRVATLLQNAMAEESSTDHVAFVDRVLDLPNIPVHKVMTPRNYVAVVSTQTSKRDMLSVMRKHGYSRYPVFDTRPRNIIGYVDTHSLLANEEWGCAQDHMEPALTINTRDSVATALVRLQTSRKPMAIIVDRKKNLLGIITLKDLLEELTGELHDW